MGASYCWFPARGKDWALFDVALCGIPFGVAESEGRSSQQLGANIKETNMTTSSPREIPFRGVRLRFDSKRRFDQVLAALLADVGAKPLALNDIAAKFDSWESYKKEIESHVGPCGFILFAIIDHGSWIKKVGILKKVSRLVIGNPLLAITMIRHDVTAGLFAPVELLLVEEDDDQSSLIYVKPSSLMVVETNDALLAAAKELDAKFQALAAKVTMA